jgi:hypothetical protein
MTDPKVMAEYYDATIGAIQSLSANTDVQQNTQGPRSGLRKQ